MLGCSPKQAGDPAAVAEAPQDQSGLADDSDGRNWPAFGRTYGEQHASPLTQVNDGNVQKLGLAWSFDLPPGLSLTGPLEVDGTLFAVTGYSVIHALEAKTGKLLWEFDPHAPEVSGRRLRQGWGSRGLAYWNHKVYTGTQDGRLIAVDAATGKQVWSAQTFEKQGNYRFISGPPRVFNGKVIIGHGGADADNIRGYVTAYDAETGKQLWRFWTVPGDPAKGFENDAMRMAAKTWFGQWWKYGGGGTVWNAMTYDAKYDQILIGVGNGAPWNRKIRSEDKGDNLFLSSVVALDANTGAYKWHHQVNPGESWDYNAAMDMELADLPIDGRKRSVVMTAPKDGFFYVIDRTNGKLLSAEKIAKVTWASKIDLATGRPVENPEARYPRGKAFALWPSLFGAHNWLPMAYLAKTGLVYIPVTEMATVYDDRGIEIKNWKRRPDNLADGGTNPNSMPAGMGPLERTSRLMAWDPVKQREVWRVATKGAQAGSVMASAGNLVFEGQLDGQFVAYRATDGKKLWAFQADSPVLAPPITYSVNGVQYVTVLSGNGASPGMFTGDPKKAPVDYRSLPRRILTFRLGGDAKMSPAATQTPMTPPKDWDFAFDKAAANRGGAVFGGACAVCHGMNAVANGGAPDLRVSPVPASKDAFDQIVRQGGLVAQGMPQFDDLTPEQLMDIRQYLRAQGQSVKK